MADFPDVLGMELHDATALLEAEGLEFLIAETKTTKKELTEGVLRIIRVKARSHESGSLEQNQLLVLTVCRI